MLNKKFAIHFSGITILFVIAAMLLMSGCAFKSMRYKKGIEQLHRGTYDEAVKNFEEAYKENPSHDLRVMLFRARLGSYYHHLALARTLKSENKKDEAVKEYKIALGIFPGNKKVKDELDEYLEVKKEKPLPFKSTIIPPVTLDIDSTETMSLNLRSTPITKIFKVVGKSYGVNFIFDKDFRDFVYSIDIEQIGFYEILNQLCMIGNAEYRILDKTSILIYPNTTFKKRTFGLKGVKVFYLENTKAEDAKKLLMTMFRDQQIQAQEDTTLNSLIIKGDFSALREIEKFLNSIDKRKSEVALNIQILEITKSLINAIGLDYGDTQSPISSITAGTVGSDGALNSTLNFNDLKNTSFFLTIPSAALSFLESSDNSKIIARPNLRGLDGEEIKFLVGDEVPVPQTQFQAGAAGGFNNIPVTTYQYRNVGVEIKLTPMIHRDNEVTIKIKLAFNSIAGTENGFPIFGKREMENVIRLKEGETNIIGGFIRDEVRGAMRGIPGFSRLPIIGKLFGSGGKNIKQTDLVFSITPRIIRQVDVGEYDKETIWSDTQISPSGAGAPRRPDREPTGRPSGSNSITISPGKRRSPVNTPAFFTLRLNTSANLQSLSIGGSISGGKAVIEDLKANFFGKSKVDVLKNHSDTSFDLGYSFPEEKVRYNVIAQLKVKFLEKGNYTIDITNVSAMSKERQSVEIKGASAEIEVY
jgi:type II secretory pathway component GspD/PulD (secretin)